MRECRGDGTFVSGVDVEQRERKPFAFLRERTSRRRQSFPLCERTLERLQALARDACLLAQRLPLRTDARVEHTTGPRQLGSEHVEQRLRALAAQLEPLAGAAQAV